MSTAIDRLRTEGTVQDDSKRSHLHRTVGAFFDRETIVWGVLGGIIATAVMTAYRLPIARSLPPTARFWATYVGDGDPDDYPIIGLCLHTAYGAGGGMAFAVLAELLPEPRSMTPETGSTLYGLCYGVVLSIVGERVILGTLLDMDLDPDESAVFHASHIIYGLTLGSWVGSRGEPDT